MEDLLVREGKGENRSARQEKTHRVERALIVGSATLALLHRISLRRLSAWMCCSMFVAKPARWMDG